MPMVKINLRKGRSAEAKLAMADAVQAALVNVLGVPEDDRFAIVNEVDDANFIHKPAYLDMQYSKDLLMIEITFLAGRTDDAKKAFLLDLNQRLVKTGFVREDDVFVAITEVAKTNISFGKGLAQRAL